MSIGGDTSHIHRQSGPYGAKGRDSASVAENRISVPAMTCHRSAAVAELDGARTDAESKPLSDQSHFELRSDVAGSAERRANLEPRCGAAGVHVYRAARYLHCAGRDLFTRDDESSRSEVPSGKRRARRPASPVSIDSPTKTASSTTSRPMAPATLSRRLHQAIRSSSPPTPPWSRPVSKCGRR